ncbi:CGH_1_collapsed_G0027660.mRNA.1.CDS.1 [Saccharomyces cerevisiae]|nr:CGH_1_collapsed_G0027660.mRNA.1.CDS.1 [Saccharomyces cerevisiae]
MQQSQKIIANPTIPEGIKWRNFFILQLLNNVGQMLKRLKIYGIRTFFNYFQNKSSHLQYKVQLVLLPSDFEKHQKSMRKLFK